MFLHGFLPHLDEACVGSISEIFDAQEPYTPRGVWRKRGVSPRSYVAGSRRPPRSKPRMPRHTSPSMGRRCLAWPQSEMRIR